MARTPYGSRPLRPIQPVLPRYRHAPRTRPHPGMRPVDPRPILPSIPRPIGTAPITLPRNTTNQLIGSGGSAVTYPASARAMPEAGSPGMSDETQGRGGDPFSSGTTRFQDDDQQQVKRQSFGSGEE